MVGKISMGHGATGAISYCYYDEKGAVDENGEKVIRGELLYSNGVFEAKLPNGHLHVKQLGAQFHQIADLNDKTNKFLWHQTFNFPPGEEVSNETMVKIARDFAQEFGFENNQYLVFRHRDKPHEHFHIIANRINEKGENTATDQHNYERIQAFSRKMEKKYGLLVTENYRQKLDARHNRQNGQVDRMKRLLDEYIPQSKTLSELNLALKKKGVIMHLGRGISFTSQKYGLTFKGSDLGREYSRQYLERRLGKAASENALNETKRFDGLKRQELREAIDRIVARTLPVNRQLPYPERQVSLEASWKDFENKLTQEGVTLRLARDEASGRILGATFQTGTRRYVTGKELGETYTSRNLALRFGLSEEAFARVLREIEIQQTVKKDEKGVLFQISAEAKAPAETEAAPTRVITGPNSANETNKDLAKIEEAIRKLAPKRRQRPK